MTFYGFYWLWNEREILGFPTGQKSRPEFPSAPPPHPPECPLSIVRPILAMTPTAANFEAAFVAALAPVHRLLRPETFSAARASPQGPESSPFHRIYNSPPVVAAAQWLGARSLRASEAEALEAAFDEQIRQSLSRAPTGHTEDALALQLAVVLALVFVETTTVRPGASRNLLAVLVGLWRRHRVPGEAGSPPRLETVDDLLVWLLWLDLFWTGVGFLLLLSSQTKTEPVLDPAVEFPTVPVGCHHRSLPRPSVMRQNGPILPINRELFLPYACADVFRWMDAVNEPGASEMLHRMIGGLPEVGFPHLEMLLHVACLEYGRQARWLADETDMSAMDVLAAEYSGRIPENARALAKRALQRRTRWRDALKTLESALPRRIATAFHSGNLAELRKLFGDGFSLHEAVGFLTYTQMHIMLGVSPEPFANLVASNPFQLQQSTTVRSHSVDDMSSVVSADTGVDAPTNGVNGTELDCWFLSPNHTAATRAAEAVCTGIRIFLRSSTPEQIARSVYTIIFCIAATHVSWIRLLELRQFCRNSALSNTDLERCSVFLADLSLCTTMLRASGLPHCTGTADLIAGLLDGERTAISRTDLLGLRMARLVVRKCPHGNGREGGCWACATEMPEPRAQVFPGSVFPDDTLAAGLGPSTSNFWQRGSDELTACDGSPVHPVSELEPRSGRNKSRAVTFSPDVEIGETYHKEDYRTRSMFADWEEQEGFEACEDVRCSNLAACENAAATHIELPDLKLFWPAANRTTSRVI
ncbi:hypothetical protein DFJ74DRAFT_508542, partial [Hyaloraphidium curvatum]